MPFALIAEHFGGCERQHRAQAFSTGRNQVVGDLGNHLDVRASLGEDQLVHPVHVRFRQIDKRLDGCLLAFALVERNNDAQ